MRHSVFALAVLAAPAAADDFTVLAPVTEAEIYLTGAMLTRAATVDLPAGEHRILIPHVINGAAAPRLTVTGATLGPVETLPNAVADGRLALADEQRAAYDAWQAAVAATQTAEDTRLRTAAAMKSAEDALTVLRSMSGAALETLQPDAVGPFAAAVSSNVTAAEIARADARQALRDAERAVRDANLVQTQALLDFNASGGQLDTVSLMAVGVTLAEAGAVSLEMDVFTANAGWAPTYDVALSAEDTVTFDRKASIYQSTGLPFTNVALTLSTVDPYAQISPRRVGPNQAVLNDPRKSSLSRSSAGVALEAAPGVGGDVAIAASPVRAPARQALTANSDGVVVTYDYPSTVSLAPGGGELVLAIDSVSLDARVFNRAAVRSDRTAFLMAEVVNTIGEPLLPGQATFYREDVRIGEAFLSLIPAGDDADLSFGPQQFLRVEFVLLENETGDRGLFTTSGTRRQDMVFRIRNLSNEAAEVEARYGLPFSEVEDLEIAITTRPQPTTQDVDDLQNVAEWVLDVPASGEAAVEIGVALEWPEGQTLIWNP